MSTKKKRRAYILTLILLFSFTILHFYSYGLYAHELNKYKNIFEIYSKDITKQNKVISNLLVNIELLNKNFDELEHTFSSSKENIESKIDVLDTVVNSKDKRLEKIRKVRKITKETITKYRYNKTMNILGLTKYAGAVVDYSSEYDIPIPLILAVTRQESAFNPRAVSHAGAQGLMQLMPGTAKECVQDIGKRFYNIYDIRTNVQLGTFYLRKMLTKFKDDIELAVKAYNAGPTYVTKILANEYSSYPKETIDYAKKVVQYHEEYKLHYN